MSVWIEHTELIGLKFSDVFKMTKKHAADEVTQFVRLLSGGTKGQFEDQSKLFPWWKTEKHTILENVLVIMPRSLSRWRERFDAQDEAKRAKALNHLVNQTDMKQGYKFCKTLSVATECFFTARSGYNSKSKLRFSNKSSPMPVTGTIYANDLPAGVSNWKEAVVDFGQNRTATVQAVWMTSDREIY